MELFPPDPDPDKADVSFVAETLEPYGLIGPFSSIENQDAFYNEKANEIDYEDNWDAYYDYINDFFLSITGFDLDSPEIRVNGKTYSFDPYVYFVRYEDEISKNDMKMAYNYILNKLETSGENNFPLYSTMFKKNVYQVPNKMNDKEKRKVHCGAMSGTKSFRESQRSAIYAFTEMNDGDVLAVSGPPGTGKTTFIQSALAELVTERAIKEEAPPLIVASSYTNKAVENIIDSFANASDDNPDVLHSRWIKGVNSFASFYASDNAKAKAERENKNYLIFEEKVRGYSFTSEFIVSSEDDFAIDDYEQYFISCFCKYFSDYEEDEIDIITAREVIHKKLIDLNNKRKMSRISEENADMKFRYDEFYLAVHYYEAGFLIEKRKGGNKKKKDRLRLVSYLTPCIVSTFYKIARLVKYQEDKFLYLPIDLFIVDEAGMASPESSMFAFAFAKRALVVGDAKQIEPVVKINESADIELLKKFKLLPYDVEDDEVEDIFPYSATRSNLMKIAQLSTFFKSKIDNRIINGVLLREHQRCYDSIINYCNKLCYHDLLIPKKGEPEEGSFPTMGYYDIETEYSDAGSKSSRRNMVEVKAIVDFIDANADFILEYYQNKNPKEFDSLEKCIGIITPFTKQANELDDALKGHHITCGTIHTFQGSEKPIIIFSSVYGSKENCFFINNKPNMLNVAVSRAKDCFWVLGSIEALKNGPSPSSLLIDEFMISNLKECPMLNPIEEIEF